MSTKRQASPYALMLAHAGFAIAVRFMVWLFQELEYQTLVKRRDDRDERRETELDPKVQKEKLMRQATVRDQSLPLDGLKRKVMRNLQLLESDGMVSPDNNYQDIVDAIARVRSI